MTELYEQIQTAVDYIRARSGTMPRVGLILGSGLGTLADAISSPVTIAYSEIPGFAVSTVVGHAGALVVGQLGGQPVVAMRGRIHYYEGYDMQQVTFPVRVLRGLGAELLIVTNAAGGIRPGLKQGEIMLINDQINLPGFSGVSPLRGPNDERLGLRFNAMNNAYDPALRAIAKRVAAEQNITLPEGVYMMLAGPTFETPAEVRLVRLLGADAVGMSTVPEVIVARHGGMRILGFSTITNEAISEDGTTSEANHEEVLATANLVGPRLRALIEGVLAAL